MNILKYTPLLFLFLLSCDQGFKKIPGDISYKIIKEGQGPKAVNPDDYYYGDIIVMNENGEKLLCDGLNPEFHFIFNLEDKKYSFDITNLLPLLKIGDSVLVKSPADSFFFHYYGVEVPGCVAQNKLLLSLVVKNIMTLEQYEDKIIASKKEMEFNSIAAFDDFIRKNNIKEDPSGFGIIKSTLKAGSGKSIIFGNEVSIHFEQQIMNGRKIQSTFGTDEPIVYIVGGDGGIQALDFGLNGMKKGETAVIYAPYFTAFGDKGLGSEIPPYSNMIFKVEVLDIK